MLAYLGMAEVKFLGLALRYLQPPVKAGFAYLAWRACPSEDALRGVADPVRVRLVDSSLAPVQH